MTTIRLAIPGESDERTAYESAASRVRGIELVSIDDDSIDAIAVTSAFPDAAEISTKASAAGQHLLIDMRQVSVKDTAAQASRDVNVRRMIGGSSRFVPSIRAVKDSLTAGKLGAPGLLRIHQWRANDDASFIAPELDLANWIFGVRPTEIYATGAAGYVQVHLGFPDGGMALIDSASALTSGGDYFSLCMIGSTGAAYVDEHYDMQLLYRGGHPSALKIGQGNTHLVAELREFAAAIEQNREPSITIADVRAAMQVVEAVTRSIDARRALRLVEGKYEFV